MAGGEGPARKSDLGVRTASALVMAIVAGSALWLGGWFWTLLVASVATGVLWEWRGLVAKFEPSPVRRGLWIAGGFAYIAIAAGMLVVMREDRFGLAALAGLVGAVIATDIGAYFAGRAIGGPKIAPAISPSKTWAGLAGGILGATLVGAALVWSGAGAAAMRTTIDWGNVVLLGALLAITAQAGDFFESWMKRRAGVKDSSNLIPGHGGLFDRLDGLLAVFFFAGLSVLLPVLHALFFGPSGVTVQT